MRKNEKITALYERLSRDDFGKDDDQQRESNSISNQKAMLEDFAARQGFTNIVHFTDDGISGTCFDRPGFLAMMKEVLRQKSPNDQISEQTYEVNNAQVKDNRK